MNDQFEPKISNIYVGKLRNSPAITRVFRLDLANFRSQLGSSSFNQRLPTTPYCIGIPGGHNGPVVIDFATAKIAGGWIYAAQSAGAKLPPDCVINSEGIPTRDPADYFDGGAILPAGEQKGYSLALMAELIAEAMLGPVKTECNWLLITLRTGVYQNSGTMQAIAEEILAEIRACPPAPGFDRVMVPGERERQLRLEANGILALPPLTLQQLQALAAKLGA